MQRVVILGGGVGGTLTANLIVRKLRTQIVTSEVSVTVVDATGQHEYQPGYMYIAMGGERLENLRRPERSLLDRLVNLVVGKVTAIDDGAQTVTLKDGAVLPYDFLVVALGARIVPGEIEHFDEEAQHFYTPDAALRLRKALDAFKGGRIVIGIAGIPYKCPPAPLEVALLIETELRKRRIRDRTEMHFFSPINRAFTIEEVSPMIEAEMEKRGIELHTFFNVETIDPVRKVVASLEGEEFPYDLLILVPPHKGAQVLIDSGLAPGSGWLPTDKHTLQVGGRSNVFAVGDTTDLPLSKAGSTAHFEAPVVAERVIAAIQGRPVRADEGHYTGRVMCFFEVGDGKGTLLQFDYENPPKPPRPNRVWHLGKIVFNKTYWQTVPRGRI
jgi:sulfide:quinone oxidoreductase